MLDKAYSEITFTKTLATAMINGAPVRAAGFFLIPENEHQQTYVTFYGDMLACGKAIAALTDQLSKSLKLRELLVYGGPLIPVEQPLPTRLVCGGGGDVCVLDAGHEGCHQNINGDDFDDAAD